MLLRLNEGRRTFSVIFIIVSAVILAPFIFSKNNFIISFLASLILFVHLILALVYFFKGISTVSVFLVYYMLLVAGILFRFLLLKYIKFPDFIDAKIIDNIGLLIPIIFVTLIPLPKITGRWVSKKIITAHTLSSSSYDNTDFSNNTTDVPDDRSIAYSTYAKHVTVIRKISEYITVKKITRSQYILRSNFSTLLIFCSFLGLLIGPYIKDSSDSLIFSWFFWITSISAVMFVAAIVIYLFGFNSGLISIMIMTLIGFGCYFISEIMRMLLNISFILDCFFIVFLILLIIYSLMLLNIHLFRKHRQPLNVFEDNNCIYAVDLFLNNSYPVKNYSICLITKINLNGEYSLNDFDYFNSDLLTYCTYKKIVFSGIILDSYNNTYTVYLYINSQKQKKMLERYFKRKLSFVFEIRACDDPDWSTFKDQLAPSDLTLIKLHNRYIISNLTTENFDFSAEVSLIFTAAFDDQQNALGFIETFGSEYEEALYFDNSDYARQHSLQLKHYHLVHFQKTFRISEAWLDMETLNFHQLAKENGGEYEFIQFGKLSE